MSKQERPIPEDEYATIAKNVPVVSVDLLVHHDGGLILGKRQNEPAKGEWFVPGGSVIKGETRQQAIHRVAELELGCDVTIDEELGTYDHFYQSAETAGVESKHYLATAYVVTPVCGELQADVQHENLKVFSKPFPNLHNYVDRYIRELQARGYEY